MDVMKIDTYRLYRSIYAPVESNMYILIEGDEAIVVDSNINEELSLLFNSKNIKKVHLFLTHEHYDHSCGVHWLKNKFDISLYCHKDSKGLLSTKKNCTPRLVAFVLSTKDMSDGGHRAETFMNELTDYDLEPDVFFFDNQILEIANHRVRIIHVPGHTPASSLIVMDEKIVFTGDSLIKDNKIITSFRGGNKEDMLNITLPKLKALQDDLMVLPGHGETFMKKEFDFSIYDV